MSFAKRQRDAGARGGRAGVTGAKEAVAKLNRIPLAVRERVEAALLMGGGIVLQDMRMLTPRDPANPGAHAQDGLTVLADEGGLRLRVGLPTQDLASDYFWFRFLDGGTKGGEVTYWRRGKDGRRRFTMQVPSRPALRIRERALDGNIDEVRALVAEAIAEGLREA